MSETLYDLYLTRELVGDADLDEVKQKVAALFKTSLDKVEPLFADHPRPIKKAIDQATLIKYKAALHATGAGIIALSAGSIYINEAVEAKSNEAQNAGSQPATPEPSAKTQPTEEAAQTGLNILPAGSDVLSSSERTETVEANIDTSHLTLASVFASSETETAEQTVSPNTDHIALSPLESYVAPSTQSEADAFNLPDISELELAPQEGNLTEAKPDDEGLAITIPEITLASVGDDLIDQKYKASEPETPPFDISHISLENT